ncbi:MAG: hypothetical protein ACLQIB_12520 [Isosphaeraceae bacterium]
MSAHQQVGSFEVVNHAGVLARNGGNVASYFCTPDGRVIHAVTGPVPGDELLAAARWAVDVSSGGKALDDPELIGAAHREELQRSSRPVASPAQQKVHRLLASQPLPPLNEVYQTVFEEILGQRVSPPDTERVQAERAFAAARRAKLPVLLILHKRRDNQAVLDEWNRLVASPRTVVPDPAKEEGEDEVGLVGRGGQETLGRAAGRVRRPAPSASPLFPGIRHRVRSPRSPSVPAVASAGDLATTKEVSRSNPLTALAGSYVVVALRLEELPALSHQLGIPPYAAPDRGSPLFVIARSDARQLSAVTSWDKSDQLAYAMAQGIVQEAKEHERTPEQLRALLAVVDPVDAGLGDQVRKLLRGPDNAGSHRAGQVGGPPKKA